MKPPHILNLSQTAVCVFLLGFPVIPATAAPEISEFMAANGSTLADENGDFSDWIEIHNPDAAPVSLSGYHLTDNAGDLTKWTFPPVTLNAGEYLIVFASDKDRSDPEGELHTNFKLGSSGEYLALIDPDGTTVVTEFAPVYPPQYEDESFGLGETGGGGQVNITPVWTYPGNYANIWITGQQQATLNGASDNIDVGTGAAFTQFYMWFDFSGSLAALAPGAVVESATLEWSGAVQTSIFGASTVTSDLGIFPVPDGNMGIDTVAADYTGSNADIANYYAANTAVSSYSAVPGQNPTTTWNIRSLVQDWIDNPTAPQRGQLMILSDQRPMHMEWDVTGTGSGTPQLAATVTTSADPNAPAALVYFDAPTPGAANSGGQQAGPVFRNVTENPPQPVTGALTVTAEIIGSANPVASVQCFYRRAFNAESVLAMTDDGTGVDATAGDGIWSAEIPAIDIVPGEMTRWRFVATDSLGVQTKKPAYREPLNSHQYFGTVGHDPAIESNLNVLHWFVQNPAAANNVTGTRGAVFYNGEFYDNVHFNRHGQSTGGFVKKSYNLDFNRTQRFRWSGDAPRVADIDLLTNWADKSKVRHPLAWEIMRESGVNAHYAFTIRVEQNGEFFSVADFVEDGDDIYLERAGLNKDGALYKVYNNRLNADRSPADTGYAGIEKKNRKSENNDDLQALIDGLDLTGQDLTNYIHDNIDIPKCVNMLAANSVIRNIDMHSKNWYIYRDTGKTNEWAILPWDLDLSGGRVWNSTNTYFDNQLYTQGLVVTGNSIRLVSHLFSNPDTRSMILRRIRTLSDTFLQPESTPLAERWYERRLDEQAALIDDPAMTKSDAQRDFEKWGSWIQGSEAVANGGYRGEPVPYTSTHPDVESMAEAIVRWKTEYLPGRRNEIYNNQTVGNGGEIPLPQTNAVTVTQTPLLQAGAACTALVPSDNSEGLSWIGAIEPYDDSGWLTGTTGVGYERGTGYAPMIGLDVNTAMQANNSIYIRIPFEVADASAFDSLEFRIQVDDGFVAFLNGTLLATDNAPASLAWNSSANGNGTEVSAGSYDIYDVSDKIGSLKNGTNILAIQGLNQGTGSSDFLIRPELFGGMTVTSEHAQPVLDFGAIEFSPASGNQDEEYIEVSNPYGIAVDVSGWQISGGVEFTFQPGTVIPPGGNVYITPDVNAFRARAESPTGGEGHFVQGGFSGHLSSFGETLFLLDADGNELTSTTYTGNPSDVQLYLVVSEILYHPLGDGLAEFIELTNISDTVTLNLSGVRFVSGVEFDFTGSAITSLGPGERVLITADIAAFEAAFGTGHPVAGEFANLTRLNNDGETLKLEDALNGTIKEFRYNDAAPWPVEADTEGHSLVLIDASSNPDPDSAGNWRISALPGGNPGSTDVLPFPANPLGDEDGNGIQDLIDYAAGNSAGIPIPPSLSLVDYHVGGQINTYATVQFTTHPGAERARIELDCSNDLTVWEDAQGDTEIVSQLPVGDGRTLVTVRLNEPFDGSGKKFIRLRVEAE